MSIKENWSSTQPSVRRDLETGWRTELCLRSCPERLWRRPWPLLRLHHQRCLRISTIVSLCLFSTVPATRFFCPPVSKCWFRRCRCKRTLRQVSAVSRSKYSFLWNGSHSRKLNLAGSSTLHWNSPEGLRRSRFLLHPSDIQHDQWTIFCSRILISLTAIRFFLPDCSIVGIFYKWHKWWRGKALGYRKPPKR